MAKFSADKTQYLGKIISVIIDRPLGSRHPVWGFEYLLNYGYIAGIPAPDGEDQDVYVMGIGEPIETFTGECVAVIIRADDVESKLVLAPVGMRFSREQIADAVRFQEQFFKSRIILPGDQI